MVKSHEFISKTILKNFSFSRGGKERLIKYIHVPSTRIRSGNIKTFNRRLGAYTNKNEHIMNSEFETYLGDLNAKIEKELKTTHVLHAPDFNLDKIKKYFMYQCWRDGTFVQEIVSEIETYLGTQTANAFKGADYKNIKEAKNFFIAEEFYQGYANNVFADHELIIAIDPYAGLIGSNFVVGLKNDDWYSMGVLALSPKILFVLVYQKKPSKINLAARYTHKIWRILESEQVAKINAKTIGLGQQIGSGYIISDSKEKLREAILESKDEYAESIPSNVLLSH